MKKRIFLGLFFYLTSIALPRNLIFAQDQFREDYSLWQKILGTYVDDQGRVDYAGLKKNRRELDQFIEQIQNFDLSGLKEQEQIAFWINAYNALTIQTIIDHYPVKSIRHIQFGLVWKIKTKVATREMSLDDIEHKILRPKGDPRIHFAINCASLGCPRLSREAFYSDRIDQQLNHEANKFINDPEKVRLDPSTNTLFYSSIFDWYRVDFEKVSPTILDYIKHYLNKEDSDYLAKNKVNLKIIPYNWGLNRQ